MRAIPILITVIATFYVVPATPQAQTFTVNIKGKDMTYPAIDKFPDLNDPQVKAWVNELDLSKVPDLPISNGGKINPQMASCDPPTVIQPDQGSWTCQKFTAEDDIQTCPTTGNWGLTYDDGPSESTPKLLDKLKEKNLKATFFVVGSRVAKNPGILKAAFDAGHNIAVHTWSHPALTSLPNEGVVAELKWTLKIIKDVTGVTPKYMRPPYGDTDNRVRAVARACGLTTVLWEPEFDSNDWTLTATPPKQIDYVLGVFETWMQKFPKMKTGFIVLEHDLHPESVEAAMEMLDRAVKVPNLNITTVPECVGDTKPYLELGIGGKGLTEENKNGVAESSINTAFITTISMFVILFSLLI